MSKVIGILLAGAAAIGILFVVSRTDLLVGVGTTKRATTTAATSTRETSKPVAKKPAPSPKKPSPAPSPTPKPRKLPEGFEEKDISPYYGKITITSIRHPNLSSPSAFRNSYSEISISAGGLPEGDRVVVTGWRVQARNGFFVIPKGNEVLLPTAFSNRDDIVVKRGDKVRIFSHKPPVELNFRLNKCVGYFSGYKPSLPKQCPKLYEGKEELAPLTPECQDYLRSLGSCRMPSTRPPVRNDDYRCFELLAKANYQSCLYEHQSEPGFFLKEWRVWLGNFSQSQRNIFHPKHDRVLLFDGRGLLVDEATY